MCGVAMDCNLARVRVTRRHRLVPAPPQPEVSARSRPSALSRRPPGVTSTWVRVIPAGRPSTANRIPCSWSAIPAGRSALCTLAPASTNPVTSTSTSRPAALGASTTSNGRPSTVVEATRLPSRTDRSSSTESTTSTASALVMAVITAEHAVMTAITSADAVEVVLSVELDLSVRDGSLVASTTVLGLPLDVVLAPRAAGREVEVDVTGFVLAGASVQSADLPAGIADQLQGIRFAVEGLPAGMTLTQVDVTPGGLRLSAEGRDLALTAG